MAVSYPSTPTRADYTSLTQADQPASTQPRTGRLIVFTGPSGVGKGTLLKALRDRYPALRLSISATTRSPRPGEVDGKDYYFVSRCEFQAMIDRGDLLEWAEFAGNLYGTPRQAVFQQVEAGEWVILEIELEGARQVRESFPKALQVFVLPPSLEELEQRIRSRGKDADEAIQRRLDRAQVEIEAAPEFDRQIVNDDLEVALEQLEQAIFD
ncbi:guanylate kinase [Nodosilinea sp. P-1105]|uniref:guanylate kinase n=1 Tax=Nodosilinea sp. P-1105 TaxID=2546229 RepID=UPI00146A7F9E|nr:guanylate kinase [Nodosilinea sp. P-1105]NMF84612.1 guanylate kinase [Nodosilinea sp. P-1105]